MTSISPTSSQSLYQSPLDRLQSTLASEISAGTINSSDQSALSSALTDIDNSLKGGASGQSGAASPTDIKTKINDLISGEVSSGNLTSAQAAELQKVFSDTFSGGPNGPGGAGGAGGAHHAHHGHHGHAAQAQPAAGTDSSSDPTSTDPSSTDSSSTTSLASDINNVLQAFQKLLQDSTGSNANYSSNGQSSNQITALLINYQS